MVVSADCASTRPKCRIVNVIGCVVVTGMGVVTMLVVEMVAEIVGGAVAVVFVLPDNDPPTDCVVAAGCGMGV